VGQSHLRIARRNGTERVIAIDAYRRRPDDNLDMALSKHIAAVRKALGSRSEWVPCLPAGDVFVVVYDSRGGVVTRWSRDARRALTTAPHAVPGLHRDQGNVTTASLHQLRDVR
jgi:hypothetical protein